MTILLRDLASLTLNRMALASNPDHEFTITSEPTELQSRAFELLDVRSSSQHSSIHVSSQALIVPIRS